MTRPRQHPAFHDDIRRILGDHRGELREPPSRAEDYAIQQLLLRVAGTREQPPADLGGRFAGQAYVPGGAPLVVRYVDWGGYLGQWVPPDWIPRCRIWIAERAGEQWVLGLSNVESVSQYAFPEVNTLVARRLRELLGEGTYVELKAGR